MLKKCEKGLDFIHEVIYNRCKIIEQSCEIAQFFYAVEWHRAWQYEGGTRMKSG